MKNYISFIAVLLLMIPVTVLAATNDPTALHDRGNQKLVGSLSVSDIVTTNALNTNYAHITNNISSKNIEINQDNLYTYNYIYARNITDPLTYEKKEELSSEISRIFGIQSYDVSSIRHSS